MKGGAAVLIVSAVTCLMVGASANAATEKVLHSFCSQEACADGSFPQAGLINIKGTLYGTTAWGGGSTTCTTTGCGTVFSLNRKDGAEKVVHSFQFSLTDGIFPAAGLTCIAGKLYGTTLEGGADGWGTLFSIDLKKGRETMLYSFQNSGTDGAYPVAGLIDVNGTLYGTTEFGGTGTCSGYETGCGTVFSFDPNTNAETVLYSFQQNSTDGRGPVAGLIDVSGTLYGTTKTGGAAGCNCGTVFSVNPSTGAETVVYSFQKNGTDGQFPLAALIDVSGTLYGTTEYGGSGSCNCGTVFSFNPATNAETPLYSFQKNGTDGESPFAGLTSVSGTLYGTTYNGGSNGYGTVFSVNPGTGAETVVYSFGSGKDAEYPQADLFYSGGKLYGTTAEGGTYDGGTVFSIVP